MHSYDKYFLPLMIKKQKKKKGFLEKTEKKPTAIDKKLESMNVNNPPLLIFIVFNICSKKIRYKKKKKGKKVWEQNM